MNDRSWRLNAKRGLIEGNPSDTTVKSNIYHGPAGTFNHIQVTNSGSINISPEAYPDDVAAFLAGAQASNPHVSPETQKHLIHYVDAMDRRAVQRHGYSNSPAERDVAWVDD